MKKTLVWILSFVLLAVGVGSIYFFAFEKTVPTSWVNAHIEAVKGSTLTEDGKVPKSTKYTHEEISYSKNGEETVKTYDEKVYREFTNKSTETEEGYEIKSINYNEKGEVAEEYVTKYYVEDGKYIREEKGTKKELDGFSEVLLFFVTLDTFYEDTGALNENLVTMIDENLEKVTQKGFAITLHLVKDDISVNITYDLLEKKVVKIEAVADTYSENVLTNRVREVVEF